MPRAVDPEAVAQARELSAAGCSLREIARTLGTSAPTIKRWLEIPAEAPRAPSEPPVSLPAHMKPPEAIALAELPEDTTEMVRQLLKEVRHDLQVDRQAGLKGTAVSSAVASIEKLSRLLKQLESAARADQDGVFISTAEHARIEASLEERIKAQCNRPLLCDACSRALSVQWGTGKSEAELSADPATDRSCEKCGKAPCEC